MKLKKINPNLAQSLAEAGLAEPTELQKETFGTIKSGVDCVLCADSGQGKTTTIVINVIQRLEKAFEQSPRALIFVDSKEDMLEMMELFRIYGNHTDLRVYGVHDKGDIDYDKNQISIGIDVLIGTTNRLSEMFSSAGYDVNQLKMFVLDDADIMMRNRLDGKIARISDSTAKTQRLMFCSEITDKLEIFADRIMVEPLFFELDEEEDFGDEETNEADE